MPDSKGQNDNAKKNSVKKLGSSLKSGSTKSKASGSAKIKASGSVKGKGDRAKNKQVTEQMHSPDNGKIKELNTEALLNQIEPKVKLWLEVDGEVVFGGGRVALFQAIEETGSIKQASEKIRMSYRAAWGKIKATEDRLGIKLVKRQAGGRNSGAELTPKGREILMIYRKYRQDVATAMDNAFSEFFQDFERC